MTNTLASGPLNGLLSSPIPVTASPLRGDPLLALNALVSLVTDALPLSSLPRPKSVERPPSPLSPPFFFEPGLDLDSLEKFPPLSDGCRKRLDIFMSPSPISDQLSPYSPSPICDPSLPPLPIYADETRKDSSIISINSIQNVTIRKSCRGPKLKDTCRGSRHNPVVSSLFYHGHPSDPSSGSTCSGALRDLAHDGVPL